MKKMCPNATMKNVGSFGSQGIQGAGGFAIRGARKTSAQADVRPKALSADFLPAIH